MINGFDDSLVGPIQPGAWLASTVEDQVRFNVPGYGEIQDTLGNVGAALDTYYARDYSAQAFRTYVAPANSSKPASSLSPLLLIGALALGVVLLRRK